MARFRSDTEDKVLGELLRWGTARLDAGPGQREVIGARIDSLLDGLWDLLPEWRKDELRRETR